MVRYGKLLIRYAERDAPCGEENMEFTPEKKKKLTRWLIGVATACILIFLGVQNIGVIAGAFSWLVGLVMPLIIGCAIAMIVNVPMRLVEKYLFAKSENKYLVGLRRPMALAIAVAFIGGILIGVVVIVLPELIEAVKIIINSVTEVINYFRGMSADELAEHQIGKLILELDWSEFMDKLKKWAYDESGNIVDTVFGTATSLLGGVIDLFVSIVFAMYILLGKDRLKNRMRRMVSVWLPERFGGWLAHAVSVINVSFRNFITGQSIEAMILGILCLIGMWIFGFPYAPMVATLIGVTALVPVVGAWVGGGIGAFMILTVDPMKSLFFIIFILALQQLEENLIYPRVMGHRVNLPGMWILAAVSVGGGIGGPVGMLLGVPIVSSAYVLINEFTDKREAARLAVEKECAAMSEENSTVTAEEKAEEVIENPEPLVCEKDESAALAAVNTNAQKQYQHTKKKKKKK